MKRFVYRLERLLSVRRMEERERARRVAEMLATEAMHQERVDQSKERRDTAQRQISDLRSSVKSAGIQLAADNLYRSMRQDVRRAEQARAAAALETEQARDEYVEARQRTRALERLRERRHKYWKSDAERTQNQVDDEVAEVMRRRREIR